MTSLPTRDGRGRVDLDREEFDAVPGLQLQTIAIGRMERLVLRKPGEEIVKRHRGYAGSEV